MRGPRHGLLKSRWNDDDDDDGDDDDDDDDERRTIAGCSSAVPVCLSNGTRILSARAKRISPIFVLRDSYPRGGGPRSSSRRLRVSPKYFSVLHE